MKAIVNGKSIELNPSLHILDSTLSVLINGFESNGCGDNVYNTWIIQKVLKWLQVDVIQACYIHDADYMALYGTANYIGKVAADARLHTNLYILIRKQGYRHRKALFISRIFHMSVIIFGHKSAGLRKDLLQQELP